MSDVESLLAVFIISTIIFISAIYYQKKGTRCNSEDNRCFDGNGKYQYKGRGSDNESIEILLQRISWSAKNGVNNFIFSKSYLISYCSTLGIFLILYCLSKHIPTVYEFILFLLLIFVVTYSITGLFGFHTDRYPFYYIRNNTKRIQSKMGYIEKEPPNPQSNSKIPHRTIIRDVLNS